MKNKFLIAQNNYTLLLGNGENPGTDIIKQLAGNAEYIACVDGGAVLAKNLKIVPNLIIGDLDSVNVETLNYFQKHNVSIIKINSQENNDLEKALKYIIKSGYNNLILAGFMGKRDSQNLATLQVCKKYINRVNIQIFTPYSDIYLLNKGSYEFSTHPNQIISLISFPRVFSITTKGLKYLLDKENLYEGSKGISNKALANSISINFTRGTLLLIMEHSFG